jgi:putative membrane protein insertion efficiency factor
MGYGDSSAQFGRDRGIFGVDAGAAEGNAFAGQDAGVANSNSRKFSSESELQGLKPAFFARFRARLKQRPTKNEAAVNTQVDEAGNALKNDAANAPENDSVEPRSAVPASAENSSSVRNAVTICDNRNMDSLSTQRRSSGARLLLAFVHFYRVFFSPFLGGACKFYPSCSRYAEQAIAMHGPKRGAWLALKRLGRCRPFTKGGFDPVQEFPQGLKPQDDGEFTLELTLRSPKIRRPKTCQAPENLALSEQIQNMTYRSLLYGDADWLRTMSKEQAQ